MRRKNGKIFAKILENGSDTLVSVGSGWVTKVIDAFTAPVVY